MRNITKINRLADLIEECDEVEFHDHKSEMGPSFTMLDTYYACGSPACLVGHNNEMHGRQTNDSSIFVVAEDLGISLSQAVILCAPESENANYRSGPHDPRHITKAQAVAVLRHLADEGVVLWSIFEPYKPEEVS